MIVKINSIEYDSDVQPIIIIAKDQKEADQISKSFLNTKGSKHMFYPDNILAKELDEFLDSEGYEFVIIKKKLIKD